MHGALDSFGFQAKADLEWAGRIGISGAMIQDSYHTSGIFEPRAVLDAIAPHILNK